MTPPTGTRSAARRRRPVRIAQVSDLHLGADLRRLRQSTALAAFGAFAAASRSLDLDAVIVSGDIVVDHPDDSRDRLFARRTLDTLGLPVHVVPGNHDVGDHRIRRGLPPDWHGPLVTSARVRAWQRSWGRPYWRRDLPGWVLFGLNSQVMGSGLPEEAEQLCWLRAQLDELRQALAPALLAVFMHEGVIAPGAVVPEDAWPAVPMKAGARLLSAFSGLPLRLIASGHTHRHAQEERDGTVHITAPSTAGPIPFRLDMLQVAGSDASGFLVHEFRPGAFSVEFVGTGGRA